MRVEATIAELTARQLLTLRRGIAVAGLAAMPVAIAAALLIRGVAEPLPILVEIYTELVVRVVLPIVALIFGTGAFGSEIEEGTAVYLLTKPVARWRVALIKLATAATLTAAVVGASALLAGVVALRGFDDAGVVAGFTAGVVLGSVIYCALFVALGLVLRRALIAGLAYVLVWEALAAETFAGTRTLSIRQYALSAADAVADVAPDVFAAPLPTTTALPMAVAVLSVATFFTIAKLRRLELAGRAE
jgi:ABC-2 type transport system permease protein